MVQYLRKNGLKFKITAAFVILVFASTGFSSGFTAGRILPKGKVTLYDGSQKIGEFSSEAPLPENTLLAVQGECGVKLQNLYLFAVNRSVFSVSTGENSRTLNVQRGTVYFVLSSMPRTLVFQTPAGVITTNEIMLKASSSDRLLKGYVRVDDGITKMGVLEGGSMLVTATDDKPLVVSANHELRLAQAEIFKEEGKTEKGKAAETGKAGEKGKAGETAKAGGMSTTTKVVLGVLAVGGIIAVAAGGGGGGGGEAPPPASPSAP